MSKNCNNKYNVFFLQTKENRFYENTFTLNRFSQSVDLSRYFYEVRTQTNKVERSLKP